MRFLSIIGAALVAAACSSSTDTSPTRWNFGIVNGANQLSTAGSGSLAQPITSQLTRDPQGKFASNRVLDFLLPTVAYAQGLTLSGTPVAGAIVCGREAKPGEPQVVPLCVFTLADGTAPSTIISGTKAGTYNVLFTAQVASQLPVKDSTTVTVAAGPVDPQLHVSSQDFGRSVDTIPANAVLDIFGNSVPFAIKSDSLITVAGKVAGTIDARRIAFSTARAGASNVFTPIVDANGVQIAWLDYSFGPTAWRFNTWSLTLAPR